MNLFELFVKLGVDDQASDKVSSLSKKLGNGLKTAAKVGVLAVGAVTAAVGTMATAFVKGTSDLAEYGDNIDKMSQKMGISAKAYQEWDFIMQHSGTSMESLQAGMKTLANAVENDNKAFKRLGITQSEIASMNQEELFAKTIEALQGVTDETERTYLAGQLLGRGATELGPLLNSTAEDIDAMRQQVHELGGVMSDDAVKAAAAYQDSLQNMKTAFSGVQRGMLSEFLPSMVSVMDGLSLIFSGNNSGISKITEGINQFADKLMESIPQIFELGEGILKSLSSAILDNLPILTNTATSVILRLVDGIISALPQVASGAISIVKSLIRGLSENFGTISSAAVDLIEVFSGGLLEMLPEIVSLGLDLIISLANGLSESLPELIPTIVDVVLQIVETLTNPDTLSSLIDAAIAITIAIADGLIAALPDLLEKAPVIIQNLVDAIVANTPKLLEAALLIIVKVVEGILANLPQLLDAGTKIVFSVIEGIVQLLGDLVMKGKDLVDSVKSGFSSKIEEAKTWGKDLIQNFIDGLTAKWQALKQKVSSIAQTVKDYLGFSEPKKGPLSNFHTYAPDMMDLFIKGIRDNERKLTDQIEKTFNFGSHTIPAEISYSSVSAENGLYSEARNGTNAKNVSIVQNIYSEAKTAADLMQEALYQQERAVLLGV